MIIDISCLERQQHKQTNIDLLFYCFPVTHLEWGWEDFICYVNENPLREKKGVTRFVLMYMEL